MLKRKILFNVINVIFVILYLYPGSIIGFLIYGDINKQPQLTGDFIVSSNHLYAFLVLSVVGLFAYYRSKKIFILNYLILASIIFEILHLIIPNRSFQFSDLFGNVAGVFISIFILMLLDYWRKK